MNIPELLGKEVNTPDGKGYILSLHNARVIINLYSVKTNQVMTGKHRFPGKNKYSYEYKDVSLI